MSIVYNIEGPKGSGKSTLIRKMIERGLADQSRGFSGKWEELMTDEIVEQDSSSNLRYVHDRGYLSHFIYAFLMSAEPDFNRVRCNGPKVEIMSWRAANLKMLSDYLDQVDSKMIILYSDYSQILNDRISKRLEEEGKGASEAEWEVLERSNQMYKLMATFMKSVFPDKVLVYRIEEYSSTDLLLDQIIEDSKGGK